MPTFNPSVDLDTFCEYVEQVMTPRLAEQVVGFAERVYAFFKIRGLLNNDSMHAKELIMRLFGEMAEKPSRFVELPK